MLKTNSFMKKQLILSFIISFILSCSNEQIDYPYIISDNYSGLWSGSFEGDDNGTWTLSIDDSKSLTGTFTSKLDNIIYNLEGAINDLGQIQANLIKDSVVGSFYGNLTDGLSNGTFQNNDNGKHGVFSGRISTEDEAQILNTWHFYSSTTSNGEVQYYDNDELYCENLFMEFKEDGTFIDDFDNASCEEPQYYGTFSVQDGYYELLYVVGGVSDMSDSDIYIEYPDENTIVYEYNTFIWTYKIDINN